MKKTHIILSFILILTLTTSLISAGLCLGRDKYYHDCDDNRYFDDRDYDDEYYYHGTYYPVRDYYYRNYYRPRYRTSRIENYYKDVEEYTRTTEYRHKDRYGYENIKTIILEKTEIESDYEIPYYASRYNRGNWYNEKDREEDEDKIIIRPVPWHYSVYKNYY
jgi:hypothetical protein